MLTFYIFDTIILAGTNLTELPVLERLHKTSGLLDSFEIHNSTKLDFVRKTFLPIHEINTVLRHIARVNYAVDGLIFQPFSFKDQIFKWKNEDTVDVLVSMSTDKMQIFYMDKGKIVSAPIQFNNSQYSLRLVPNAFLEHIKSLDMYKGVIECSIDSLCNNFLNLVPINMRPDKTKPNSRVTIQRTLKSFTGLINLQDIVAFCTEGTNVRGTEECATGPV